MFEGTFSPPVYNDRYNFLDGAQNDIFIDSYLSIPQPAPNAPMPLLADVSAKSAIPTPVTSDSKNNNNTTSGANTSPTSTSVDSSSDYSNSYKRDMSDVYMTTKRRANKRFAFMEMSRRSRRSNIHRRERLGNMW